MYSNIEKEVKCALDFKPWNTNGQPDEEIIQKRLKNRHNALTDVFNDTLIIGMIRKAKTKVSEMDSSDMQSVYRLSVIDLFVEKAIVILEGEADKYQKYGKWLIKFAAVPIVIGIIVAGLQLYPEPIFSATKVEKQWEKNKSDAYIALYKYSVISAITQKEDNLSNINQAFVQSLIDREVALSWKEALVSFVKSFTFYGLLVLSAVILKRFGKALIDQSERLYNRRHALREGRLYLHLQNGRVETVEEFDKVFNWNASQSNAFADIPTDAQAPWGNALKEALNIIPKTVEAAKSR